MSDIDQLATALAKAQGQISNAEKSRKNEHFRSKYATLADVWDACRGPLTGNGLSIAQLVRSTADGVEVETMLLHASGQSLSATLTLPVDKNTAQGLGSALTYGRRYGLAAMVGVCPDEDDDGHAATQSNQVRRDERREPERPAPARDEATSKQVDDAIGAVFKQIRGVLPEVTAGQLREAAGFKATGALTIAQRTTLLRSMEQRLKVLVAATEGDPPPVEDDDIPF